MEEKEISLNFNFCFFSIIFLFLFSSILFLYYVCSIFFTPDSVTYAYIYTHTHTLSFTNTHTHRHRTRTDTFTHRQTLSTLTQGTSSTRYFTRSLLTLSLSVFYTLSFALSVLTPKNIVCCVLHQLPFCLIFNFSVRLNLHAWLLYVKSRTGAL